MANIYSADFENTVDEKSIENKETRVWAAGLWDIHTSEDTFKAFTSIDEWFEYVKNNCPKGSKIYFHNMNYDIQFVMYHLNKLGYECVYEANQKTGKPIKEKSYYIIGTDKGNFYQTAINFDGNNYVLIRDSLKLVAGKLAKIGKDLKIDEQYWKIEEPQDFYTREREEGHQLTDEEYKYLRNDVLLLGKILLELEKIGMLKKLTAASYALEEMKKCIHLDVHPNDDMTGWYTRRINSTFRSYFPLLSDEDDQYCRNAYKGGWCYNNTDGDIKKGHLYVYDINSMYPSMLHGFTDKITGEEIGGVYPIGYPDKYDGKINDPDGIYIVHIYAMFTLKKDHLPFIQVKNHRYIMENEFITDSGGYMELYLCKPDFELLFEQYDVIDYKIIDSYDFSYNKGIFKSFIDKFYKIKEEGAREKNPTKKMRGKSVLNSSYGKMGQRGHEPIARYNFDENGILRITSSEDDLDDSQTVYVPVAAFCTAYARSYIVRIAQKHFSSFYYSDTDSCHSSEKWDDIWIDKYAMGAWDCEEDDIVEARYIRQKCYIEIKEDGEQIVKAGGLPAETKQFIINQYGGDLINKFDYGFSCQGKLMRKKVKGGVILKNSSFEIKKKKLKENK